MDLNCMGGEMPRYAKRRHSLVKPGKADAKHGSGVLDTAMGNAERYCVAWRNAGALRCKVVRRESVEKLRCGQRQSGTRWHGSDEGGGASRSTGEMSQVRALDWAAWTRALGTAVGIDWHRSAAAQQGAGEISQGRARIRYAEAMCRYAKPQAGATDGTDWRGESVAWICGAIADALFCTGLLSRGYDRM